MARNLLGIDIGGNCLKLVLTNGTKILNAVCVEMPDNLVIDGRIVSPDAMADLIREAMKANGMKCRDAALSVYGPSVYVRNITMPQMSVEQLEYNLPYEFKDYINDELKNYVFDYAMQSTPEELEMTTGERGTMDLFAVAVPKEMLQERSDLLRKAGLKLVKAAPDVSGYASLIRLMDPEGVRRKREYCVLDLGYNSIGMDMYRGDCHMITRVLDYGLHEMENIVADIFNVDIHLAHTYFLKNHEDCQNHERCKDMYDSIAVEMLRAVNFYSFNHPDSDLSDIWICGGGAEIPPLMDTIKTRLEMEVHSAAELIPDGDKLGRASLFVQAVGVTQD